MRVGYYTSGTRFTDAQSGLTVNSRIHAVPVDLMAIVAVQAPYLTVTGGLGATSSTTYGTVSVSGQRETRETFVDWGGIAAVGGARTLGPGEVAVEVSFAVSSHSRGQVETAPGGLLLAVGYRWLLW